MSDKLHDDNMRMLAERAAERKSLVTPGGNPVCPKCGNWYGPGQKDTHPCTADRDDLAAITNAIEELAWESPFFEKGEPREFAQVVASMVLESEWLRERDAAKWNEGVRQQWAASERVQFNPYSAKGDGK